MATLEEIVKGFNEYGNDGVRFENGNIVFAGAALNANGEVVDITLTLDQLWDYLGNGTLPEGVHFNGLNDAQRETLSEIAQIYQDSQNVSGVDLRSLLRAQLSRLLGGAEVPAAEPETIGGIGDDGLQFATNPDGDGIVIQFKNESGEVVHEVSAAEAANNDFELPDDIGIRQSAIDSFNALMGIGEDVASDIININAAAEAQSQAFGGIPTSSGPRLGA
jgi:hypothetical protein